MPGQCQGIAYVYAYQQGHNLRLHMSAANRLLTPMATMLQWPTPDPCL